MNLDLWQTVAATSDRTAVPRLLPTATRFAASGPGALSRPTERKKLLVPPTLSVQPYPRSSPELGCTFAWNTQAHTLELGLARPRAQP